MPRARIRKATGTAGRGPFAQPGMEPPLNRLFDQLRDIWRLQHPNSQYADLAYSLGVDRQQIAQWATGTDKRRPPWYVIMWLCSETGYEIRGDGHGWRLLRRDGKGGFELVQIPLVRPTPEASEADQGAGT